MALFKPGVAPAQTSLVATTPAADHVTSSDDATTLNANSDIVVYGTGRVRQEQTLDRKAIDILPPGSSPLKAVARLP